MSAVRVPAVRVTINDIAVAKTIFYLTPAFAQHYRESSSETMP